MIQYAFPESTFQDKENDMFLNRISTNNSNVRINNTEMITHVQFRFSVVQQLQIITYYKRTCPTDTKRVMTLLSALSNY